MKYVFRSTGTGVPTRQLVQRAARHGLPVAPAPRIDLEDMVERVYRRWQDELRRERERGAW